MSDELSFESHAQVLAYLIVKEHRISHTPVERIRHAYFGVLNDGPMWDRVRQLIREEMG